MVRDSWGKIAVALCMCAAIARASTASPPTDGKPITNEVAKDAYRDIVSRERSMRHEAALKFRGDPWSQDDDFHQREETETRSFASSHETRIPDVLRAIDDGMHLGWPPFVRPDPRAPPCRPRLAY